MGSTCEGCSRDEKAPTPALVNEEGRLESNPSGAQSNAVNVRNRRPTNPSDGSTPTSSEEDLAIEQQELDDMEAKLVAIDCDSVQLGGEEARTKLQKAKLAALHMLKKMKKGPGVTKSKPDLKKQVQNVINLLTACSGKLCQRNPEKKKENDPDVKL